MSLFGKRDEQFSGAKRVDTYIGKDTAVEGSLKSHGTVRIDGSFVGEIETEGDVIVGEGGLLRASGVKAKNVTVAGECYGNLKVQGRLEIVASGKVLGDVFAGALVIEDGAVFHGNCEMPRNGGESTRLLPGPITDVSNEHES